MVDSELHPYSEVGLNIGFSLYGKRTPCMRFTALLATHPDDLPDYLRQTISFLKSNEIPVNWNQLFLDLHYWDDEDHLVQKKWASAFWGSAQTTSETTA